MILFLACFTWLCCDLVVYGCRFALWFVVLCDVFRCVLLVCLADAGCLFAFGLCCCFVCLACSSFVVLLFVVYCLC